MRNQMTLLLGAMLVFALATTAFAGGAEVGQPAPDFTLTDHLGNTHHLADYAGKTVVLEWTNPDCPFVQRHYAKGHTTMIDLQAKVRDHDVVWLAIDSSHFATAKKDAEWAKAKGIEYPILIDASGEVGRAYGAKTTPHMFVISAKGTVLYNGAIDDSPRGGEGATNYVAAALHETMQGQAVTHASTKPYGCSVKYAPQTKAKASAGAR